MGTIIDGMVGLSIYREDIFKKFHSKSQIAGKLTESWFEERMYCPFCLNEKLSKAPNSTKVFDFTCRNCNNLFQLKAQAKPFSSRVLDGAYQPMIEAIYNNNAPNFSFMQYSPKDWLIDNLFIVPNFFFTKSCIEIRKPLTANARRAGWIGCNILLKNLPKISKIAVIDNRIMREKEYVHNEWKKLSFMKNEMAEARAWTSDVLYCINRLNKKEFTLEDIYKSENYLSKLHPKNYHIKPKIRQQLQILRDKEILIFRGSGRYSLK